jgi:hypothetical protein
MSPSAAADVNADGALGASGPEAAGVKDRFRTAWSRADVTIRGSCFCRRNVDS